MAVSWRLKVLLELLKRMVTGAPFVLEWGAFSLFGTLWKNKFYAKIVKRSRISLIEIEWLFRPDCRSIIVEWKRNS